MPAFLSESHIHSTWRSKDETVKVGSKTRDENCQYTLSLKKFESELGKVCCGLSSLQSWSKLEKYLDSGHETLFYLTSSLWHVNGKMKKVSFDPNPARPLNSTHSGRRCSNQTVPAHEKKKKKTVCKLLQNDCYRAQASW